MRRLFEGGVYSRKYGISVTVEACVARRSHDETLLVLNIKIGDSV